MPLAPLSRSPVPHFSLPLLPPPSVGPCRPPNRTLRPYLWPQALSPEVERRRVGSGDVAVTEQRGGGDLGSFEGRSWDGFCKEWLRQLRHRCGRIVPRFQELTPKVGKAVPSLLDDIFNGVCMLLLFGHYRKEELLALLDAHCREENQKIPAGANAILSEFNFLYLPIDFVTENNLGYAFVNYTSSTGVDRLYKFLHHRNWAAYISRQNCEVTYARFQGLASLLHHFSKIVFTCFNKEFMFGSSQIAMGSTKPWNM